MGGAFGDSDSLADLPQQHARIVGDAREDLGVVGQELPAVRRCLGHVSRLAYLDIIFLDIVFMLCCSSPRCSSGRWRSCAHPTKRGTPCPVQSCRHPSAPTTGNGVASPKVADPVSDSIPAGRQQNPQPNRVPRSPLLAKLTSLTSIATVAAAGMIVVGALAVVGGHYDKQVVHDQLAPQKIFFPEARDKPRPRRLRRSAGAHRQAGKAVRPEPDRRGPDQGRGRQDLLPGQRRVDRRRHEEHDTRG